MFSTRMSRICVLKCRRKYTNSCKSAKRHSEEKPVRTRAAVLLKGRVLLDSSAQQTGGGGGSWDAVDWGLIRGLLQALSRDC